jgi:estrogen-related receptor beta like 1
MDNLLDNLRILGYHKNFLSHYSQFQPLRKSYFSAPDTNPNAQFYYFACLVHWLATLANKSFDEPQQFDDPNATISNIRKFLF